VLEGKRASLDLLVNPLFLIVPNSSGYSKGFGKGKCVIGGNVGDWALIAGCVVRNGT
jgi:hypothetical protein